MRFTSLLFSALLIITGQRYLQQSDSPMVFVNPVGSSWEYDLEIQDAEGEVQPAGTGRLECVRSVPIHPAVQRKGSHHWDIQTPDSSVVGGPWQFRWSTDNGRVFEEYQLVETTKGIVRITTFGPFPDIALTTLLLPRDPYLGQKWAGIRGAYYTITATDSLEMQGRYYPTIRVHWTHVPDHGGREDYVWAIGFGIVEYVRSESRDMFSTGRIFRFTLKNVGHQ